MAIDTAERRRSAGGVIFLPLGPGVTANAAKDDEWRFQSAWGYSGITVAGQPAVPVRRQPHWVYRSKSGTRRIRAYKRGN